MTNKETKCPICTAPMAVGSDMCVDCVKYKNRMEEAKREEKRRQHFGSFYDVYEMNPLKRPISWFGE